MSELKDGVEGERRKYRALWRINCEQLVEYDAILAYKEAEIESPRAQIAELETRGRTSERFPPTERSVTVSSPIGMTVGASDPVSMSTVTRAEPHRLFSGERSSVPCPTQSAPTQVRPRLLIYLMLRMRILASKIGCQCCNVQLHGMAGVRRSVSCM